MKKISILFIILFFASLAHADMLLDGDLDSTTIDYSAGDSSLTLNGTASVSNGYLECTGDGADSAQLTINADDIINDELFHWGAYVTIDTWTDNVILFYAVVDGNNYTRLQLESTSNELKMLDVDGGAQEVIATTGTSLVTGKEYYISFRRDATNNLREILVDGIVVGSDTGAITALDTTPTAMYLMMDVDGRMRNVAVSGDYYTDLYARASQQSPITFLEGFEGDEYWQGTMSIGDMVPALNDDAVVDTNADKPGAGTNGLNLDDANGGNDGQDYALYNIIREDLAADTEGRVGFWWYCNTWKNNVHLFKLIGPDNDDRMIIWMQSGDELGVYWEDNAANFSIVSSGANTFVVSTWYFIELAWRVSDDTLVLYKNGTAVATYSGDAMDAWGNNPLYLIFGNQDIGTGADYYIDGVIISKDPTTDLYALTPYNTVILGANDTLQDSIVRPGSVVVIPAGQASITIQNVTFLPGSELDASAADENITSKNNAIAGEVNLAAVNLVDTYSKTAETEAEINAGGGTLTTKTGSTYGTETVHEWGFRDPWTGNARIKHRGYLAGNGNDEGNSVQDFYGRDHDNFGHQGWSIGCCEEEMEEAAAVGF